MTTRKPGMMQASHRQRGYALIGIIAAVGITATTVVVTTLSTTAIRNQQERKTNAALALAKLALIGRAASDENRPGSLPCPDAVTNMTGNVPDDGIADMLVFNNCPSYVGRLPWRTLGLPDLRDADGERLWYAVSPNYHDGIYNTISSNTAGQLTITGTMTVSNVAAIVFAPGKSLHSEQRDTAERRNTVTNYLESYDAEHPTTYSAQAAGSSYNDRMLPIVPADIMAVVQRRVAKAVMQALIDYAATVGGGYYPPAALASIAGNPNTMCTTPANSASCTGSAGNYSGFIPGNPSPAPAYSNGSLLAHSTDTDFTPANWFDKNGWRGNIHYAVSPDCAHNSGVPCSGSNLGGGTYSASLGNSQKVTLTFSGVAGSDAQVIKTTFVTGVP